MDRRSVRSSEEVLRGGREGSLARWVKGKEKGNENENNERGKESRTIERGRASGRKRGGESWVGLRLPVPAPVRVQESE